MTCSRNEIVFVENVHRHQEDIAQRHEARAARNICQAIKDKGLNLEVFVTDTGSPVPHVVKRFFSEAIGQYDDW